MIHKTPIRAVFLSLAAFLLCLESARCGERPNVVIVISDDQGYGDLSCHGNPEINTPNIDALHAESIRLTNFHVDPTCSPTRSALMTGKYSRRVGVWHTVRGRSLLPADEITMAEHFAKAGYETAIFGKWHLGDNYPLRPQDQGFGHVLIHGGGGVGQTPDFWGNDYFDDTYQLNGHWKPFDGYCTDVWFRNAQEWVASRGEKPFLLYLATNAPHAPYNVADHYARPFREAGIPSPRAEFYGMITNLDENVGRLRAQLEELGLAENTIFLFMTDNGTAAGHHDGGFNGGMRGAKGTPYEGGHHVPCFIHWPEGGFSEGREINTIAAHFDLLPTLAALCDVPIENEQELDGRDLSMLLKNGSPPRERSLIVESQRLETPEKWRKCAVLSGPWRLINGEELYNLEADPGQTTDLAERRPEVVENLHAEYERWWDDVSVNDSERVRIVLGADAALTTTLTAHDWQPLDINETPVPWSQQAAIAKDPARNGYWSVNVAVAGRYAFQLRRRPASHPLPINAARAMVACGGSQVTREINPDEDAPTITLDLPAGPAELTTTLVGSDGRSRGAYYVTVKRLGPSPPAK